MCFFLLTLQLLEGLYYLSDPRKRSDTMLKIGEFSKLCRVSVKTLRYYSSIELLIPDAVNGENGYRYYSPEKLCDVAQIRRLKGAGFPLEVIRELLHGTFDGGKKSSPEETVRSPARRNRSDRRNASADRAARTTIITGGRYEPSTN
jgi:DNA-binding transcriptional MerR regulator